MKEPIAKLQNPYQVPGRWYKGEFHIHTTNSDGSFSPEKTVAAYVKKGFKVIGVSDHYFVTQVPQSKFPGVLFIPTAEIAEPHLLHIGCKTKGELPQESYRQSIARIRRDKGFAVINHPHWSNLCTCELKKFASFADAMEIYNHVCEVENASGYSVERWDMLLKKGLKIWGFANDDDHFRNGFADFGGGFVVIKAKALTQEAILSSLSRGSFYISQGPSLHDLKVGGGKLRVKCSPVQEIRVLLDDWSRGKCYYSKGKPKTAWDIDYQANHDRPRVYMRVEIKDAKGRRAWSNPLFVKR